MTRSPTRSGPRTSKPSPIQCPREGENATEVSGVFCDGSEGFDRVSGDAEIDLVITDLEMPKMNGLELTRAIRGRPESASLPVVIVTSLGSEDDRRAGVEAGANAYMVKRSFDQHALLDTVERLVGT